MTKGVLIMLRPSSVRLTSVEDGVSSLYPSGVRRSMKRTEVVNTGSKMGYETWKNEALILEGSDVVTKLWRN